MKPALNQQAIRTTNGTQNWTDASISSDQTLQLLFGTEAVANNTTTANGKLFVGATDLTNNTAFVLASVDATAASSANATTQGSNTKCVLRTSGSGTQTVQAAVSAALSNGDTLNYTTTDATAYLFNALSLAGSDHVVHLSSVAFATTDTSKVVTHGDSSAPDAVLIFFSYGATGTDSAGFGRSGGIAFWDGTNSVGAAMQASSQPTSPVALAARINTDLGHLINTLGNDDATLSIGSVGATTFTLSRTSSNSSALFVTCISIRHTSGTWAAQCGVATVPASAGNLTVASLSVPAQVLLTVGTRLASTTFAANSDTAGSLSFGVACNNAGTTQQMACAMTEKNGVTTTAAKCYTSNAKAYISLDNTGAPADIGTLSTFNGGSGADTVLNFSNVNGASDKFIYLAFGLQPLTVSPSTGSDSLTGIAPSVVGAGNTILAPLTA